MKKFLLMMLLIVAAATFTACSRSTVRMSSKMNASAATAQIRSEGMRIWSRPLEIGFVVDQSKGDNGRIVSVYPKPGEVVSRELTRREATTVAGGNRKNAVREEIPVYGGRNFRFEDLDPIQQAAVLSIIKDENLDGFYVTMIEETIATTVTSKKKLDGDEVHKGSSKYQVIVKGLALKIQEFGEVSPERADAERNAAAASEKKETVYIGN